jgi:dihydrofolate reductase
MINLIVAMDRNRVIGVDNKLPWHLPADLKYFKEKTLGSPVVMGRKTFESIGRPLPKRTNVVITRQQDYKAEGIRVVHGLEAALELTKSFAEVFVLGGGEIFEQAINLADRVYITEVDLAVERGHAYFPRLNPNEWTLLEKRGHPADEKNQYACEFLTYVRAR